MFEWVANPEAWVALATLTALEIVLGIDRFYQQNLARFLRPHVNWGAALLFYLLYIAGILIFAVVPALGRDSLGQAALLGALFGFFTYATYDLTNLATLVDWPLKVVVVDIAWGAVLCAVVATCSFLMGRWIG